MSTEFVSLAAIRLDPDMMPRAGLDPEAVARYREAYAADAPLPPIQVVREDGGGLWLVDGWHRVEAAGTLGIRELAAEISAGDKADAFLLAAGHNATHGRPRNKADVRAAIVVALRGLATRGEPWSNRRLAELVRVSDQTIGRHLPAIEETHPELFDTVGQTRSAKSAAKIADRAQPANDTPVLDENGMLPVIDLETGEVVEVGDEPDVSAVHQAAKDIIREALKTSSPMQAASEAEHRARTLTTHMDLAEIALKDLLDIPPDEMADAWAVAERNYDPIPRLREAAARLLQYADAMDAARPQRLRAIT